MSPPTVQWIPMDTESLKSRYSEMSTNTTNTGNNNMRSRSNNISILNTSSNTTINATSNSISTTMMNNSNIGGRQGVGGGNGLGLNCSGSELSINLSLPNRHHQHRNHNSHNNTGRSGRSSRQQQREEPLLENTPEHHQYKNGLDLDIMEHSTISPENRGRRDELIEVQILPNQQQDDWGDNATAITSDRSNSPTVVGGQQNGGNGGNGKLHTTTIKWAAISQDEPGDPPANLGWCQRYIGSIVSAAVVAIAAISPIVMVVGHRIGGFQNARPVTNLRECGPECHAFLLTLSVKLVALFGAIWAIYFRQSQATMPRIFFFRAITLLLAFLAAFTFWLFYWVRAEKDGDLSMVSATAFAGGLADALLAIHYLGVLLTEIRHVSPQYMITVVRSPDGVSKQWTIGLLSTQRAAVWVLQNYYAEFPAYNPHLDRLPSFRRRHSAIGNSSNAASFKFYDLDSSTFTPTPAGRLSRRGSSHNERFYEEYEFERRVRKRRARLLSATEEAFAHIKRMNKNDQLAGGTGPNNAMDSMDAAAAIFPSLARPLQKFLRVTRQQPWHSAESVLNHLATCLRLGLAPRAFLERYTTFPTVLQASREGDVSSWALVSDLSVSRTISKDTTFLLRNGDVSLFVTVTPLKHFNITEQIIDPKSNNFALRLNSETSV